MGGAPGVGEQPKWRMSFAAGIGEADGLARHLEEACDQILVARDETRREVDYNKVAVAFTLMQVCLDKVEHRGLAAAPRSLMPNDTPISARMADNEVARRSAKSRYSRRSSSGSAFGESSRIGGVLFTAISASPLQSARPQTRCAM